jgi:hypothetical protein
MRIFRACFLAAVALGAMGCINADHWGFDSAVAQAKSEVVGHAAVIDTSGSMNDARAELDRHAVAIDTDLHHIRAHLSGLDWSCDVRDMDWVWSEMRAIEDRVNVYLTDAGSMIEMGALRSVCGHYATDMERMFDELRLRLDAAWCW